MTKTGQLAQRRVIYSMTLEEACQRFLDELRRWVHDCMAAYADPPVTDSHDQATYATSWVPYVQMTGDRAARDFMLALRDRIAKHFAETGQWHHGYWRRQEAHHGTEHYELFLGALWKMAPDDPETVRQTVDVAEHIGNWCPEVPAWYDWEHHCFHSWRIGTEVVDTSPSARMNHPDHLRFANIALLAHAMTGERRYLELAVDYGRQWAAPIAAAEQLPIALTAEGPIFAPEAEAYQLYRQDAGAAAPPDNDLLRAENLLASDAVNAFISLHLLTGEPVFRQAVERLIGILITQIGDPDATAAVAAIRDYRQRLDDPRHDRAVLAAASVLDLTPEVHMLAIDPQPATPPATPGIGKRRDMPGWYEDGQPRRFNPALMALVAELRHDPDLAARAVDLARVRFLLAREVYPHGREHGCSARTVSAIARGHGRENHAGMVTAVLAPMLAWLESGMLV